MTTWVTLIRHGETDWNAEGRWQGFADVPLNESGRDQARQAAEGLRRAKIDRIITSDLLRAQQTAQIINAVLAVPLHTDPRLREINVGMWEGMTAAEIEQQYPTEYAQNRRLPYTEMYFPGGESRAELAARSSSALGELVAMYAGEHLLVATHGGTIRMILYDLAGYTPQGKVENCALSLLAHHAGRWRVVWALQEAAAAQWQP